MVKAPALSKRLTTVFEMTPYARTAADIGCDHAHLAINLYVSGRAGNVFASDIREGPIAAAKNNVLRCGCEDAVKTVLAPGLRGVINEDVDVYIISGMGGETIVSILDEYKSRFSAKETFILQPQSSIEDLREYLYKNGFNIEKERICEDAGHMYTVMRVSFDGKVREEDEVYLYIGRRAKEARDPLFGTLLRRRISEHERILSGLTDAKYEERAKKISKLIADMKVVLEEYEDDCKRNI